VAEPLPSWRSDAPAIQRFASVRMIAVDLDGSFVHANRLEVEPQLLRLHTTLRRLGRPVVLAIATGRTLSWVLRLEGLSGPRRPRTPMVLYNGSVVVDEGGTRVLARRTIKPAALAEVGAIAAAHRVPLLAYSGPVEHRRGGLLRTPAERVLGFAPAPGIAHDVNDLPIEWSAERAVLLPFDPVAMLLDLTTTTVSARGEIAAATDAVNGVTVTGSGAGYVEIRPLGSHKAAGLDVVAAAYGVNPREVLALGDSDNDVEMLRWAGVGVAVVGATPAAVRASDYICSAGAVEGAIEALRLVRGTGRSAAGPLTRGAAR
jgi:hydroxymethylpyrimidine pyrophosphatase-like HAD family hydrolase